MRPPNTGFGWLLILLVVIVLVLGLIGAFAVSPTVIVACILAIALALLIGVWPAA